jgi:uncharacterized SAM-binding protein YcdF (DUF218 family)
MRLAFRLARWLVAAVVVYLAVTAVQVWRTGQRYDPVTAGAIVVMGAAQYDGVPSPDLKARLDEASLLWHQGYAPTVVVTGSKQTGDAFTEAEASARYLEVAEHVPARAIVQVGGRNSWQNLALATAVLEARGVTTVLVVTDPFHEARCLGIASTLGLTPSPTPTRTSPIHGIATVPYYAKETVGVALGRIIGYDRLGSIHTWLG